jgi:hypothetical protein
VPFVYGHCWCCSCHSTAASCSRWWLWLSGTAFQGRCPSILFVLQAVRMTGNQDIILYLLTVTRLQSRAPAVPFTGHAADTGGTLRPLPGPALDGKAKHTG